MMRLLLIFLIGAIGLIWSTLQMDGIGTFELEKIVYIISLLCTVVPIIIFVYVFITLEVPKDKGRR